MYIYLQNDLFCHCWNKWCDSDFYRLHLSCKNFCYCKLSWPGWLESLYSNFFLANVTFFILFEIFYKKFYPIWYMTIKNTRSLDVKIWALLKLCIQQMQWDYLKSLWCTVLGHSSWNKTITLRTTLIYLANNQCRLKVSFCPDSSHFFDQIVPTI